jgi:hypothetical protein
MPNQDKRDAASEAMRAAFTAGEEVLALLDRHWDDSGDDADMVLQWAQQLRDLAFDIRDSLGEPAERLSGGGLVKRAFLDTYRKP